MDRSGYSLNGFRVLVYLTVIVAFNGAGLPAIQAIEGWTYGDFRFWHKADMV